MSARRRVRYGRPAALVIAAARGTLGLPNERPNHPSTTICCIACGHHATLPRRPIDLNGRILGCSRCGHRQRIPLAQVIGDVYDRDRERRSRLRSPATSKRENT
jgi:hypothetical protein